MDTIYLKGFTSHPVCEDLQGRCYFLHFIDEETEPLGDYNQWLDQTRIQFSWFFLQFSCHHTTLFNPTPKSILFVQTCSLEQSHRDF